MTKRFFIPFIFVFILFSVIIFTILFFNANIPNDFFSDDPTADYLKLCKETEADAVLIITSNQVIKEWYSDDYSGTLGAMSATKSITSIVFGVMEFNGLINVKDKVGKYLPNWNSGLRAEVTLEHLLTHRSGLLKVNSDNKSVGFVKNKNEFVINLTPDINPGIKHSYSNEGAQLLSPIMDIATGMSISNYAKDNLFTPLGMNRSNFRRSGRNNDTWTYADMNTTPRDLVKIGSLIISGGIFNGKRYLSQDYINRSITPFKNEIDHGYMWKIENYNGTKVIIAEGYLNTNMYIIPEVNLIIVRMQEPAAGFTGKDESYPYDTKAKEYILRIINSIDNNLNNNEILNHAISLSRNGNENKVIELLSPIIDNKNLDKELLGSAHLTIALQYCRFKDFNNFKYHVQESEKYSDYIQKDFYISNLISYREIIDRGFF